MGSITIGKKKVATVDVKLVKPLFKLGQVVYVPQKSGVQETTVYKYEGQIVQKKNGQLWGIVTQYSIGTGVIIRNGDKRDLAFDIQPQYLYTDRKKAQQASTFLNVKANKDQWRRAIGDETVENERSPYNIENCDLPSCCGNISEARDILNYCRKGRGLIVHERDYLKELLEGHNLMSEGHNIYTMGSNLEIILKQLVIP